MKTTRSDDTQLYYHVFLALTLSQPLLRAASGGLAAPSAKLAEQSKSQHPILLPLHLGVHLLQQNLSRIQSPKTEGSLGNVVSVQLFNPGGD